MDGNNKGIQVTAIKTGKTSCKISAVDKQGNKADDVTIDIIVDLPLPISDLIKVTDLSGENVPVSTNDDTPLGSQIANAVIAKNKDATINDFNVSDDSVTVTKKPVDGDSDDDYQYGTYTAKLQGVAKYTGQLDINGTFGRKLATLSRKRK